MRNYLDIEEVPEQLQKKVRQNLKFRTGNFVWRIRFNIPLDSSTVNSSNMYVSDESNAPLKTSIRYDIENNTIEVEPLEPYARDAYYFLNITTKVKSRGGQKLKEPVKLKFKL